MPLLKINDMDHYFEDTGSGETLIFVHGLGIDRNIFNEQIDYFKNKYRVISYDLRGHGKSGAPESGYSYNHFANDLKDLIQTLKLDNYHLIGLSMGGAICARFVLENMGKPKSLTFIGAHIVGYYKFPDWPNTYKIAVKEGLDKARETWKNFALFDTVKSDPLRTKELERMVDNFPATMWTDPNPRYEEPNDLKRLAEIKIPTLITSGKQDVYFSPIAQIMKENIPQARYEEFECGHLLSFEQPHNFNSILENFLKSV